MSEMRLRTKYLVNPGSVKFGGKKRKASNSGTAGKAKRRSQRALVPGSPSAKRAKK